MSDSGIAIGQIAPVNSPVYRVLVELDAKGDGDGRIDANEVASLTCSAPPPGLTRSQVQALQTALANSLAPNGNAGVRLGGCTASTALPASGFIAEKGGTAIANFFTVGSLFDGMRIQDAGGNNVAELKRSFASHGVGDFFQNVFASTLTITDPSGHVIAKAVPTIIDLHNFGNNFRVDYKIYDENEQKIGEIRQTWESKLGSIAQQMLIGSNIFTKYEVLDANERVIATSDLVNFFGQDMKISQGMQPVAEIDQGFLNATFKDKWHYQTAPGTQIDRRVLVFLPAYKTVASIQKRDAAMSKLWQAVGDAINDNHR